MPVWPSSASTSTHPQPIRRVRHHEVRAMSPSSENAGVSPAGRRDNGLQATSFVPLAEVDAEIGMELLTALGRARIAAYLEATLDPVRELLYAAASDRGDARNIIDAVSRASEAARDQ